MLVSCLFFKDTQIPPLPPRTSTAPSKTVDWVPPPQSTSTGARLFPKNTTPVDVLWTLGGAVVCLMPRRGGVLCLLCPRPTHKRSCKYFQYLQLLAIIPATLQKLQINTQIICENTTPVGKKLELLQFSQISRNHLLRLRKYQENTFTILEYTYNIPTLFQNIPSIYLKYLGTFSEYTQHIPKISRDFFRIYLAYT